MHAILVIIVITSDFNKVVQTFTRKTGLLCISCSTHFLAAKVTIRHSTLTFPTPETTFLRAWHHF